MRYKKGPGKLQVLFYFRIIIYFLFSSSSSSGSWSGSSSMCRSSKSSSLPSSSSRTLPATDSSFLIIRSRAPSSASNAIQFANLRIILLTTKLIRKKLICKLNNSHSSPLSGFLTMLAKEIVDEIKVLVGDIDTIFAQQLIHLDQVTPTTGNEAAHIGQDGSHSGATG